MVNHRRSLSPQKMVLGGNQKLDGENEIHEELAGGPGNANNVMALSSQRQRGLFAGEKRNGHSLDEHMDASSSTPYNFLALESNWQSSSPSSTEGMLGEQRNASFRSAASQRSPSSRRFTVPFVKKIDWGSLWDKSKEWIKNPTNMALFIWVAAVGVSGAILFMVMTGMLNRALPKPQRDTWFEVSNQILNALFTLMCLYQHPRRFYHLALLCRWRAGDMLELRQAYCKDGTCKPNERKHMAVVILLLHLNCFAQYALCGLNLGYPRRKRPAMGVGLTISVAICAPAVAGLYNNLSPLGKDYEAQPQSEADEESQAPTGSNPQLQRKALEKKYSFAVAVAPGEDARVAERSPQWMGGLFDLWDDISLAYLSLFCTCCVFGWNMSRLGFGNMYVHMVTFLLFCLAPFFIFNLAAINIDNEAVRYALGLGGILLCVFGLLYGGFWRIQMRRRFNLPANDLCCGKPDVTDCFQWLCCYSCSLAQEVRTADAYQVVQNNLFRREANDDHGDFSSHSHSQMRPHGNGNGNGNHHTLQEQHMDDLSMQQPLRFAGVFAPGLGVSINTNTNTNTNTIPPAVSVIHKQGYN